MKKKYLTVYRYGTGAVWYYIYANSKQEISGKYPRLEIVDVEPEWFTDQNRKITLACDVNDPPANKFLEMMMKNEE